MALVDVLVPTDVSVVVGILLVPEPSGHITPLLISEPSLNLLLGKLVGVNLVEDVIVVYGGGSGITGDRGGSDE